MDNDIERLFYLSASPLSIEEHEKYMNEIKGLNIKVYDYLIKIDKSKWALAFVKVPSYGYSSSSVAESSNSWLKLERRCSYYDLILQFRNKVAKKQQKKRYHILMMYQEEFGKDLIYDELIEKYNGGELDNFKKYSDLATKVLKINEKIALKSQINQYNPHEISVKNEGKETVVRILGDSSLKCTCGYIEHYLMPCSHLISAYTLRGVDYRIFINDHYTVKHYFSTYLEEMKLLVLDLKIEIEGSVFPDDWAPINKGRRATNRKKINRKKIRMFKLIK